MNYSERVDTKVKKIKDLLECSRKCPDKLMELIGDDYGKIYKNYCNARENNLEDEAISLAEALRHSPYAILLEIYEEERERKRLEYNKGKANLVEIFNLWTNKEISDEEAKKLYEQIKIFVSPKDEFTSFFADTQNMLWSVGDKNSWFDLQCGSYIKRENYRLIMLFRDIVYGVDTKGKLAVSYDVEEI